jgi:hypothetical protein
LLETATSFFAPAYGATVPAVVARENVQQANALVQASVQAISIGGWALAAALLSVLPISVFFAVNAASFALSAVFLARLRHGHEHDRHAAPPALREGFDALRLHPALTASVLALLVAVTITSGTWISGIPTLVRDTLHHGAGAFSLVMVGYAVGSIASGALLARFPVRRKARASMLAWVAYLPGYGLVALAGSLPLVVLGALFAAVGQSSAVVLLNSAVQEEVPDGVLGRVLGVVSLTHRGAHATGLLLVSPLFAALPAREIFGAAALAVPLVGLTALAAVSRRAPAAPARATRRTRRS